MKKITLSLSMLLISFAALSQSLEAVSNSVAIQTHRDISAVLWDQPSVGGSGIISDYSSLEDIGVYSTDDFELTANNSISTITVYGFQNAGTLSTLITGFDVYIYANSGTNTPDSNPSIPGTGLLEIVNLDPTPGGALTITEDAGSVTFSVDVTAANGGTFSLPAGNYWLVAFPRLNIAPVSDSTNRWNWYDAGVPGNGINEAHLIDPDDVFGLGATEWTSLTDLGVAFASVAFTIEGDVLGVNENIANLVSVFPNPATSIINIKKASTIDVSSVDLFDVLGKKVGASYNSNNGTVDVSGLAQGVYVLRVNTNAGTLTQKIVKQ